MLGVAKESLEEFARRDLEMRPLYPGIIVRFLPKPNSAGLLYIPEQYRNKPIRDAVVIRTWGTKDVSYTRKNGETVTLHLKCELNPGDIICVPYWSGTPVQQLHKIGDENNDEGCEWRVIPDHSLFNRGGNQEAGEPLLVVAEASDKTVEEELNFYLADVFSAHNPAAHAHIDTVVRQLTERFDIIRKLKTSATGYTEPVRNG